MTGTPALSRRNLFKAIGVGAGAAAAPALLTSCGKGGGSVSNTGVTKVPWPTYQPFAGPPPDLPGTAAGVQAGYTKYPTSLVASTKGKPGDGSKVRAVAVTYGTPPKPVDQNKLWQAVNANLGINLDYLLIPDADFDAKMATLIAGDDLPDIISIGGGHRLPHEQDFVTTKCADLSDYLSGDKIKEYPNLANLPPYAWQGMGRIKGRIYGIPLERPLPGWAMFLDRDAFTSAGANLAGWSKDEFATAVKALSKNKQYGMGANKGNQFGLRQYHCGSFGAANDWKLDGGKFVRAETLPEFKAALAFARELFAAGAYHPDTMSISTVDMKTYFYNGTFKSSTDGLAAFAPNVTNTKFTVDCALPYHGGAGTPGVFAGGGTFGYTVLKQAPPERLKMLLRVLDYLAAPFGSKEYEFVHFGVEGVHFTRAADGRPTPTALASGAGGENTGVTLPIIYLAEAPRVLFFPGVDPESVRRLHAWETKVVPTAIKNPATGLVSDTNNRSGTTLNQNLNDGINAVIAGRTPLDGWEAIVKKWRDDGGDKIAEEFAKEYAG
jgi:putative aldouronate transport system substrate-binding protein